MAAAELDPGRRGDRLERANDVGDEDVRVGRFGVERERARLGQRERAQVVDEPAEHARLVEHDLDVGRIGRVDPVHDRLEVALDDGQRRPQLVADLGEEVAALALVGLEAGGHRVEAGHELAGRAAALARGPDADRVVAGFDPAGGVDQLVERRGRSSGTSGRS